MEHPERKERGLYWQDAPLYFSFFAGEKKRLNQARGSAEAL
jgi:hypothetical protein